MSNLNNKKIKVGYSTVNSLSNNLTQIFIDNKWLLPYLTKKLKSGSTNNKW